MKWTKSLVVLLSLTVTPLIIFISPSSELYFKNRIDLGNNLAVLYPFVWLFLASLALGIILHFFSRYRSGWYVIWFYYLAGPFYLIYTALRKSPVSILERPSGGMIALIILLAAAFFVARKLSVASAVKFFAFVAILLLLFDSYLLISNLRADQPNAKAPAQLQSLADTGTAGKLADSEKLPNIYLFLLDEFQSDLFDLTLTQEVKNSLRGFTYFPENTTLFGRTRMSIASIFLGLSYSFKIPQKDYIISSFTSKSSIPYWLKSAGYTAYAYVYQSFNKLDLFDYVIRSSPDDKFIPASVFYEIWAFNSLPIFLSSKIIPPDRLEQIKNLNFVPKNMTLSSYKGFLQYLDQEKNLPANNRFTFIYSFIPHFPYIFKDDCSLYSNLRETSPLQQSKCATKMISIFIETLRELGRFEDSLIIICADHGAKYVSKGGKLFNVEDSGYFAPERDRVRSRALLLVKPANTPGSRELLISDFQSSLLDIAPTIANTLLTRPSMDFDGIPLAPQIPRTFERTKRYYFFDVKDSFGWTDEMTEFTIINGEMKKQGIVKIENNSKPSSKSLF